MKSENQGGRAWWRVAHKHMVGKVGVDDSGRSGVGEFGMDG